MIYCFIATLYEGTYKLIIGPQGKAGWLWTVCGYYRITASFLMFYYFHINIIDFD